MDLCTIISRNRFYKHGYPDILEIKWLVSPEGLVMSKIISLVSRCITFWVSACACVCTVCLSEFVGVPLCLTSAQPGENGAGVWVVLAAVPSQRMSAPVCQSSVCTAGFPTQTAPTQSPPKTWNKQKKSLCVHRSYLRHGCVANTLFISYCTLLYARSQVLCICTGLGLEKPKKFLDMS